MHLFIQTWKVYPQALHRQQCIWYWCNSRNAYDVKLCLMGCLRDLSAPLLFSPPTATPFMICDHWIEGHKSRDPLSLVGGGVRFRPQSAHFNRAFLFTFFMDEHNTFKAIIFCLDKHEIHPLVIIERREAFLRGGSMYSKRFTHFSSDSFELLSVYDTWL